MRERGARPEPEPVAAPAAGVPTKLAAPIDWWRLDDEERAETLSVLIEWVPELVRRYGITDQAIPPCWYRHENLVQELLALFQYRNQQQFLDIAPPSAPIDFHAQFALFLARVRVWNQATGCTAVDHFETAVQPWASIVSTDAAAAWWTSATDYVQEIGAPAFSSDATE